MTTKQEVKTQSEFLSALVKNICRWGDPELIDTTVKLLTKFHEEAIFNQKNKSCAGPTA